MGVGEVGIGPRKGGRRRYSPAPCTARETEENAAYPHGPCLFACRRVAPSCRAPSWRAPESGPRRWARRCVTVNHYAPDALTKWFQSTRLETRTKESDMYASVWVAKTRTRNESNRGRTAFTGPHYRPIWILRLIDLSTSIPVGTRKMVNYA